MTRRAILPKRTTVLLVAVWIGLLGHSPARAANEGTLEHALDVIAGEVVKYLESKREGQIVIGSFDGPPGSSTGQRIQLELRERLDNRKLDGNDTLRVVPSRAMGVRGSFKIASKIDGTAVVVISTRVCDRNGNVLHEFSNPAIQERLDLPEDDKVVAEVDREGDIAQLVPVDADLSKANTFQEAKQTFFASVAQPQVSVRDSVIAPTAESDFAIEILVKTNSGYKEQPAQEINGGAFVDLARNEVFAVRVRNDADYDIGVKLLIDGLSMFEFSRDPGFRELQMVVIPAQSRGVVHGWHIDNQSAHEFLVVERGSSDAFKIDRKTDRLGTVTALVFPCWEDANNVPAVEKLGPTKGAAQNGIVRGEIIEQNMQTVQRFFGKTLLATINVQYEVPPDLPSE